MSSASPNVTQLLLDWSAGDAEARDRLMEVVATELRRQARRHLGREGASHTLQPTALVNEVYLRLVDLQRVKWSNRAQFFGFASQLMRRILVDHARAQQALKRGRGLRVVTLKEGLAGTGEPDVDLIALDEALDRLAELDPRQSRVVELKFFAGLTLDEISEFLEVGTATVSRDWSTAKAWLYRELKKG